MNDKSSLMTEIMEIRDENKLLEIFKDNDNLEIRYAIVNLIDDNQILYEIFSNEENPFIKSVALNRISTNILDYDDFNSLDDYEKIAYIETRFDETLFIKVAENDDDLQVRIAAIYRIEDTDSLLKMADTHTDYDTRVVIYKKLNGQSLTEEITGKNLAQSRIELVKIMNSEKFIKDINLNDPDRDVRKATVEKIDDENVLADIARNDTDTDVRLEALKKISDKNVLGEIARNDTNTDVRIEAIKRIGGKNCDESLVKIAENDKNLRVRITAINMIEDTDSLLKMANTHRDYDTRVVIYKKLNGQSLTEEITKENLTQSRISLVKNLDNEKFIKDINLNDPDRDVRKATVEKIDDENVLVEIARYGVDSDVRLEALKRIGGKNCDESLFVKIAENDDDDLQVRIAAIYRIEDTDSLLKMANTHRDYDTRVVLYKKLNGQTLTEEITKENLTQSRISLVKNLDNEKFIKDIAVNDSDLDVRRFALKKLNKPHFYFNLLNSLNDKDLMQAIDDIKDESQLMDAAIFFSSDQFLVKHAINNIANPSVLFELYRRGPYIVRKTAMKKLVFGNVFSHEKITDKISIENIIFCVCDKDLLVEIAREGSSGFRESAVEKIDDEEVLADIARNDSVWYVRSTAVERIDDENVLAEIARNDSDNRVRRVAVERIDDEEVLADIARNDSDRDVREAAVERIDDENVLSEIARNDSDEHIQRAAVARIDNENVLADIARNDPYFDVRRAAVKKIDDKNVLAEITRNDSDWYVRRPAVERIDDENVLAEIARNDSDEYVRRIAVERIDDEEVLADIARNDSDDVVRRAAVERIDDENVLSEIARNDSDRDVREAAVERIDDEKILADIARNDSNNDIICETSHDDLEYIARNDSDADVRYEAVKKITNEDVLIDIARNEPYGYIREAAVKKINDTDVLADIVRNDSYYHARYEAVKKITDEDVLVDIARNNSDGDIREIAFGKIRDSDTLQKLLLENFGYLPVRSYTSFKRNYYYTIYDWMGTGLYDYILDRIAEESVFIDLLHERLFGDFRVLIVRRLVSPDALRNLALNDSNYRVRLEAVRNPNLCDEETFAEIVQSDYNTDVRFEALMQTDNRDLLESISNDLDPVMKIYALERLGKDLDFDKHYVAFEDIDLRSVTSIEDENILYAIANDAPSAQLRRHAFDKIRNEDILADLACHNREFMNMALNKITDNALLLNIALYCADESVKRKAVKKIDDEEFLLRAVQRNPCNDISAYIIDHIRDESILEVIALNNSNPFNRKAAVNRIKSQDILIRLGEVECEEMVCPAIIRRCRDKRLLEYVGLSNPCKTVRRHVGSVTDDDELLYRFALKEVEYDNRRDLISRLNNEEYILSLLKRETVEGVFKKNYYSMADFKITDTNLLVDLAKNGVSDVAKRYALENIKDQSVLTDFIYSSPFISNGPKNESVWEDFQYHRDDYKLCLFIMPHLNDMNVIEDFLIENEIYRCEELYRLQDKVCEIPSIYRIVLNCKSENVRKLFKPKLEYRTNNHGRRDNSGNEENEYIGLGALFDSGYGRRNDNGNEESVIDEDREAALAGFAALFGDDYGRRDDDGNEESVIDEDREAALEGLGTLFGDDYGRGDDDENSLMSNPNFNDLKVIEDFLIENEIEQCGQLSNISERVWEIPSIYRIVLNCKSENVRKLFKPKLEYGRDHAAEHERDRPGRDKDVDEKEAVIGLRALFG